MNNEEEHKCPDCKEGLPAYMGTFADLMALLMCFFVLLLSFAEMDVMKFKRLAGSMAQAFGVQAKLKPNHKSLRLTTKSVDVCETARSSN